MYEGSDFSTCSLTFLFLGMCRKYIYYFNFGGILGISAGKEICLQCRRPQFDPWVRKLRWRRDWLPTPVFLGFPSGSDGKESTCNEGDLGSIPGLGRGHGNPLQYSCLEEPGGLHSMELQRVRKDWATEHTAHFNFWFLDYSFYWSTVVLPCYVSFCCTAKWISHVYTYIWCFLGGSDGKESACNGGDPGSIPGLGRSPRERNGYPLQYSCLENFTDRGAWRATGSSLWGRKELEMTEQQTLLLFLYKLPLLDFLPIWVTTEHWVEFPVLHSRFSLSIYFTHSNVYM